MILAANSRMSCWARAESARQFVEASRRMSAAKLRQSRQWEEPAKARSIEPDPRRADDVEQTQLVDWLAGERAVLAEPFGQLAADHASRAGNEYVHVLCSLKRRGAV